VRIAVIGTGKMGSALGAQLVHAGHQVRVGSRDAERGWRRANELHASFGGGYRDAVEGAEAVVLAVPWSAAWETLIVLGDLDGRILIDVTNPFVAGSSREQIQFPGSSGAEQLQALAPEARVVKAWNSLYSEIVRRSPDFGATPATVFVAGDDPDARKAVAGLVQDLGYEAADAGPLSAARYLEPLAGLMTSLDRASGGRTEHALKLLERPAVRRRRAQTASGTSSNRSTSTRPRSVIFRAGTTERARKARV
jgi:predicted dinucleotide-binding enzyme